MTLTIKGSWAPLNGVPHGIFFFYSLYPYFFPSPLSHLSHQNPYPYLSPMIKGSWAPLNGWYFFLLLPTSLFCSLTTLISLIKTHAHLRLFISQPIHIILGFLFHLGNPMKLGNTSKPCRFSLLIELLNYTHIGFLVDFRIYTPNPNIYINNQSQYVYNDWSSRWEGNKIRVNLNINIHDSCKGWR